MTAQAPDLTRKVIGYRVWVPRSDATLNSAICPTAWVRGTNTAVCRPPFGGDPGQGPHEAPGAGCNCGLYVLHDVRRAQIRARAHTLVEHPPEIPMIIGAVAAWGRLEVHHSGFRAQHAEIVALGYTSKVDEEPARRCAEHYGVPCVPLDQLDDVAQAHGSPVPESLRPEAPAQSGLVYGPARVTFGPATPQQAKQHRCLLKAQVYRRRSHRVGNALLAAALVCGVMAVAIDSTPLLVAYGVAGVASLVHSFYTARVHRRILRGQA